MWRCRGVLLISLVSILLSLPLALARVSAASADTEVADASCPGTPGVGYSGRRLGETFTVQNTGVLSRATFVVNNGGSGPADYTITIRTLDDQGRPTANVIATGTASQVTPAPTFDGKTVSVSFSPAPSVTAGEFLAISVEVPSGNTNAGVHVSDVCDGLLFYDTTATDDWMTNNNSNDLLMGIYVTVPGSDPPPSQDPGASSQPPPPAPPPPPAAPVTTSPDNGLISASTTNLGPLFGVDVRAHVSGPGVVDTVAYSPARTASRVRAAGKKPHRFVIARKSIKVTKAGTVKVRLIANAAAKKIIRRKGKLKATLQIAFKPTSGKGKTIVQHVTFTGPRKKKHH